jgi:hypothetical protein
MHKSDQKCLAMQEPSTQDLRCGSVPRMLHL